MRKCLVFGLAVTLVINMQLAFFLIGSENATSDEAIYGGHITSDDEWTSAESPYYIEGNVTVDEGVNLTIEPGVEVLFNGSYGLYIEGNLTAIGNAKNRIIFTSNYTSPLMESWNQIRINSTGHVLMRFCDISYSTWGLFIEGSSNNDIRYNNITKCWEAIRLRFSSHNTISDNNIENNTRGFYLWYADDNVIKYNRVVSNTVGGFELHHSNYNNITNNNISYNDDYGIDLLSSLDNRIFHNNFIGNTIQASDDTGSNLWNDSYPSGGNYWSDYTGEDVNKSEKQDVPGSDGIGDTNYTGIDGHPKAIDHYPLMNKAPETQPMLINLIYPLNGSVIQPGTTIDFEILSGNIDHVNYSTSFEGVNHTFQYPYEYDIPTNETWPDGVVNVTIYIIDTSGSVNSSWFFFIFDSVKPRIELNSPLNESTFRAGEIVDISIIEPNIKSVTHTLDGVSKGSLAFPYDINTSSWEEDGEYRLEIQAVDVAGNPNSTYYVFTVDSNPPKISLLPPGNNSCIRPGESLELNITDDHLHIVNYSLNDEDDQPFTLEYILNTSLLEDGHYSIIINAVDTLGNSNSELFRFVVDSISPIVTLVSPLNNSVIKPGVLLNFSVIEENMGRFEYTGSRGIHDTIEEPYEIDTSLWFDGTYYIYVNATDRADNSHLSWYNITIDSWTPTIALISPKNNSHLRAGTDILFDIYDANLDYANYSIDDGDSQAFDPSNKIVTTGWLDGPYNIEVFARDLAGNNVSIAYSFNLDSTDPSVVGTDPMDDQDDVLTNTSIWITFNEIMNQTSVSNALSISPHVLVAIDWSFDNLSLKITPLSILANGTKYTVRINTTAKDLAGNALSNDLVISFTTESDKDEDDDPELWWRILLILGVLIIAIILYLLIFKKKKKDEKTEESSKAEEEEKPSKKKPEKEEVMEKGREKKPKVKEKPKPPPPKEKVMEKGQEKKPKVKKRPKPPPPKETAVKKEET